MDSSINNNLDVVIVSSPGTGHLIPVLLLANRLVTHHHANVTVLLITTATSSQQDSDILRLNLCHHLVRIIELPPVDISHLVDPSTRVVTMLCLMVRSALPLIRSAIAAMDPRPDVLIADLFCTETATIADELGMAKYLFVPSTAWFTALTIYCPVLDREIDGQYVDQLEPLVIPGCKPVRPEDVVEPMIDRDDQQYHEYVRLGNQFLMFDGILLNTSEYLEPETLKAFRENETWRSILKSPVYPIGPLSRPIEPKDETSDDVIRWLDQQPNESVIFVAFGSGGMLSAEQITELAWGLELSQQRFVWVVRPPTQGKVDDGYLNIGSGFDGTPGYLPDGFITRIQDKGFLVPLWAQQTRILDHPAVGGFMSHCGWNSTLESINSGVPIVAWPLYAEQRLNATILAEELGVAVRPRVLPTKAVVGREEIESLVRRLMEHEEGQQMRDKVKQLKINAMESLKNGGPSHKAMCEMVSAIALVRANMKDEGKT
ncbi:hypothetical protein CASFOL_015417 [Castilleja foliolosa]|uniref:Glycosyltransferase n=1 Tax=Castilleja foliolosa TaxID=1961234 RepID=A0ABD3DHB7_9LAMI